MFNPLRQHHRPSNGAPLPAATQNVELRLAGGNSGTGADPSRPRASGLPAFMALHEDASLAQHDLSPMARTSLVARRGFIVKGGHSRNRLMADLSGWPAVRSGLRVGRESMRAFSVLFAVDDTAAVIGADRASRAVPLFAA